MMLGAINWPSEEEKAERARLEREDLLFKGAIHAVFATPNGQILKDWLRTACFMDGPMTQAEIESPAQTQRIAARRDLFITLEFLEKEGANVSSDE